MWYNIFVTREICLGGGIGIRNRLKICRPFGIEGSSPSRGTKTIMQLHN